MKTVIRKISLISLTLLLLSTHSGTANNLLNHEYFLERIKESSVEVYKEAIDEYKSYLRENPYDVSVKVEKCKLKYYALYDDYSYYNPNQEAFNNCSTNLINAFPNYPEVFLFQAEFLWGDQLDELYREALNSSYIYTHLWSKSDNASLYFEIAKHNYSYNEDNSLALSNFRNAISYDEKYKNTLDYARILTVYGKKEQALNSLNSIPDSTLNLWELSKKAELFLELNEYSKALKLYDKINEIDSDYLNKLDLVVTLERLGEYSKARMYLLELTTESWDLSSAYRDLLKHDLRYQNGAKCIETYNTFRDLGYHVDPLSFYRLKVFFSYPGQQWKLRDLLGIITLLFVLGLIVLIPYIWILPVYFYGHYWGKSPSYKAYKSYWGLKSFWFVSFGFLFATLISLAVLPETIYSSINSTYFDYSEITQAELGIQNLVFIIMFSLFGFAALYFSGLKILLCKSWSVTRSILTGIGLFFFFKLISGIYIIIISFSFGIDFQSFTTVFPGIALSIKENILALESSYGLAATFLLVCIIVPIYEEIIFRAVLLDSCQRYVNFNLANIIQATLFALIHANLYLLPVYFAFGIIAGLLRKKSDGLLASIVLHVVNNSSALLLITARY